jgi:hypothetical protein
VEDPRSAGRRRSPVPSAGPGLLGGDALVARLDRWAAEARVDEAARARSRERWLRQAAEEEATLAGVLADLGERGVVVAVRTRAGRAHQGTVAAIGADFVALRTATGEVLLSFDGLGVVRTAPGAPPTAGDRVVHAELRLVQVLAGLAAERERVLVVTVDGGDAVSGRLWSVGTDVAAVRSDGDPPVTAYLRLAAIGEVSPVGSP